METITKIIGHVILILKNNDISCFELNYFNSLENHQKLILMKSYFSIEMLEERLKPCLNQIGDDDTKIILMNFKKIELILKKL